jgi:hypothetical protein
VTPMSSALEWTPIALVAFVAGCSGPGTSLDQLIDASPFADAQVNESSPGDSSGQDPFAGAPPYVAMHPDAGVDLGATSPHNAGTSCLQSGCHGPDGAGKPLLIGGTIYEDYYSMIPAKAGLEVRIKDFAGHAVSVYTDATGNFFLRTSDANGLTLPAVVGARDTTSTRPMVTPLTSGMGSCGQSLCHVKGSSPADGSYYPIHVP